MPRRTSHPLQIFRLAGDLGIKSPGAPTEAILGYCDGQIRAILKEVGPCGTLAELLDWVANKVETTFRMIYTDRDLADVKAEFIEKGEAAFVKLESDLGPEVFGITYRRLKRERWEPQFVSVIDCRGEKAPRSYFTKWHEIAHLLTLTSQTRLVFRRTHSEISSSDPEEGLMDTIAGRFGYYGPIFHPGISDEISFSEIERLRNQLCPESSQLASIINFIKYWPTPCLHVRAELGWNNREKRFLDQGSFSFVERPEPVLRLVKVTPNDAARKPRSPLFKNMRVPASSLLHRIFIEQIDYQEGTESLSGWTERSNATIKIKARLTGDGVEALLIPLS
ncbi:MAG: hypothetical protein H0V90_11755 [Blastocatellia bacterium]|nr:hypothetical protein [Blastocatellia bacterium]